MAAEPLPALAPTTPPEWWPRVARWLPRAVRHPVLVIWLATQRWLDASGPQLGESIAFYTIFSLAPLLVITIAIASAVVGDSAARGQVVGEIAGLVGPVAAQAVETAIANAWQEPAGPVAAAVGIITLLVGATTVFGELRRALNQIGRITPPKAAIGTIVRVRLTAFAILLGFGFLAIASLLLSAVLAAVTGYFSSRYPGGALFATLLDFAVSVAVLAAAFGALLRWLPDRAPSRRAVWISAIVSAVLFSIGKSLIGLYLGRATVASTYGAAGSFIVVLMWVYYSAQILLYGAAVGRIDDELRGAAPRDPRTWI